MLALLDCAEPTTDAASRAATAEAAVGPQAPRAALGAARARRRRQVADEAARDRLEAGDLVVDQAVSTCQELPQLPLLCRLCRRGADASEAAQCGSAILAVPRAPRLGKAPIAARRSAAGLAALHEVPVASSTEVPVATDAPEEIRARWQESVAIIADQWPGHFLRPELVRAASRGRAVFFVVDATRDLDRGAYGRLGLVLILIYFEVVTKARKHVLIELIIFICWFKMKRANRWSGFWRQHVHGPYLRVSGNVAAPEFRSVSN